MVSRSARVWRGLLLPMAVGLLLPMQRPIIGDEDTFRPTGIQFRNYATGLQAWESARKQTGNERADTLRRAETYFDKAARGEKFPEALLALGLIRYSQGNYEGAETVLTDVASLTTGSMRVEALTFSGFSRLRGKRFGPAKDHFEAALKENATEVRTSARGEGMKKTIQQLKERGERAQRLARVGSLLASYYALRTPGRGPVTPDERKALLAEIDRLIPPSQVPVLERTFTEADVAVWSLATQDVDWSQDPSQAMPAGARAVHLSKLIDSIRLWSAAEAGFDPGTPIPPVAELGDAERRNVTSGLLRQAMELERKRDWNGALALWEKLATFPETALTARQHRIWILLQPNNGSPAPTPEKLQAGRGLIRGDHAAEDPLLYEEQLAYASALQNTAADATAVRAEYTAVLNGLPGIPNRTASPALRGLAEANLAALSTGAIASRDPAYWRRGLAEFPPAAGREKVRFYMAMQLAESALRANLPQDVSEALALCDRIASGNESPNQAGIPDGVAQMRVFRRYLARLAFDGNMVTRFRDGFLLQTDYAGERYAFDAAELHKKALASGATADWKQVLVTLEDARKYSGNNNQLKAKLDVDLAVVRAYVQGVEAAPPAITLAWNQAVDQTNKAQTREEWSQASRSWLQVLLRIEGRPLAERREAAVHVLNAAMKEADVAYEAGDKEAARTALRDARGLLAMDQAGAHLTQVDRDTYLERIGTNGKALLPAELLIPPRKRIIPAYKGGLISPLKARHVIIRYTKPHNPSVKLWLERLDREPAVVRRLVGWFNNGPIAQKTPDAKRNFSADPKSPEYLVKFLKEHLHPVPGRLLPGETQWHDFNGAGPWKSATNHDQAAAYYLDNGVALIRAACSNPLSVVRVYKNPNQWTLTPENATPQTLLKSPTFAYNRPQADFVYAAQGSARSYDLDKPGFPPIETVPPSLLLVAQPRIMPDVRAKCTPIGI